MQMNGYALDLRHPRHGPSRINNKYLFLNNIILLFGVLLLCLWSVAAQAQVARVLDSQGTALVERSGQPPRLLGRGEALNELDVISVARDSWAILEFRDQTRITLRPNTVFRLEAYRDDAPESMLLGLTKGGLRVVTGLLGKRRPDAVSIRTATATIGIRGTEFDARLCEADCAAEERAKPAPRPAVLPVARVVEMNGVVGAGRPGEAVRLLVTGALLSEGDAVAVARGSSALLVFRDGARVALAENSRFAIIRFRYDEARPREGSAFLTLYDGNALVSTGQLARISPDAFLFRTALGVIRPFGTTFGGGGCIGNFCASGSVTVNQDGASASGSASGGGSSASASGKADSGGASGTATASGSGGGGATINASTGTPAIPGQAPAGGRSGPPVLTSGTGQTKWGPDIAKTPAAGLSGPLPIPYPNMSPGEGSQVVEVLAGVQQTINETAGNTVDQGRSTAQQIGNTAAGLANKVSNTVQGAADGALNQAVAALNNATSPIVAEMTALMVQMRNNPPQTEATAQQIAVQLAQLTQQMNKAIAGAQSAAGQAGRSDGFLSAVGMALAQEIAALCAAEALIWSPWTVASAISNMTIRNEMIDNIRADPDLSRALGLVGISDADLVRVKATPPYGEGFFIIETEVATHLAVQGSAVTRDFFAEGRAAVAAAQQRTKQEAAAAHAAAEAAKAAAEAKLAAAGKAEAERKNAQEKLAAEKKHRAAEGAARKAAEAERIASAAKAGAEAKRAAERAAAEKLAVEQKQRAAEEAARKAAEAEKLAAAVKASTEAKLKHAANSVRSYDISGGLIAVVGPPDSVVPPGLLNTFPGEPSVAHVDGRVITTWVETMVPPYVSTAHGGVPSTGTVTRTEIVGPEGTTTILAFNMTFLDPSMTPGVPPVPRVGGPLLSLGPDKPGTVQVTHRAPDGKTTVSYPDNANNKPASVAVTEGEVEIAGRGRVRAGEMLASTGSPVRVPGLASVPPIKPVGNSSGSTEKPVEQGLYVWVRDGAVRVTKDTESVDVAAGNAAVVTDRVRLLDVVPNFMRFDGTPRPLPSGSGSVFDAFRAGDGSILNMCSIR